MFSATKALRSGPALVMLGVVVLSGGLAEPDGGLRVALDDEVRPTDATGTLGSTTPHLPPTLAPFLLGGNAAEGTELRVVITGPATPRVQDPPPALRRAMERLRYVASLKAGWFDGEGSAFRRDWIAEIARVLGEFVALAPYPVPAPAIFPHPDGTVTAEWRAGRARAVATFVHDEVHIEAFAKGRVVLGPIALSPRDSGQGMAELLSPLFAAAT